MRLSVALLRDPEAERRAKERAEAPTVKTEEQVRRDEAAKEKEKHHHKAPPKRAVPFQNIWRRKFRPLSEAKAVDLFADVIGDAFILAVGGGLIIYEYWRSSQKPDANKERIDELNERLEELRLREEQVAGAEEKQRMRLGEIEAALRELKDPKTKKPMLPSLQLTSPGPQTTA